MNSTSRSHTGTREYEGITSSSDTLKIKARFHKALEIEERNRLSKLNKLSINTIDTCLAVENHPMEINEVIKYINETVFKQNDRERTEGMRRNFMDLPHMMGNMKAGTLFPQSLESPAFDLVPEEFMVKGSELSECLNQNKRQKHRMVDNFKLPENLANMERKEAVDYVMNKLFPDIDFNDKEKRKVSGKIQIHYNDVNNSNYEENVDEELAEGDSETLEAKRVEKDSLDEHSGHTDSLKTEDILPEEFNLALSELKLDDFLFKGKATDKAKSDKTPAAKAKPAREPPMTGGYHPGFSPIKEVSEEEEQTSCCNMSNMNNQTEVQRTNESSNVENKTDGRKKLMRIESLNSSETKNTTSFTTRSGNSTITEQRTEMPINEIICKIQQFKKNQIEMFNNCKGYIDQVKEKELKEIIGHEKVRMENEVSLLQPFEWNHREKLTREFKMAPKFLETVSPDSAINDLLKKDDLCHITEWLEGHKKKYIQNIEQSKLKVDKKYEAYYQSMTEIFNLMISDMETIINLKDNVTNELFLNYMKEKLDIELILSKKGRVPIRYFELIHNRLLKDFITTEQDMEKIKKSVKLCYRKDQILHEVDHQYILGRLQNIKRTYRSKWSKKNIMKTSPYRSFSYYDLFKF